MKIRIVVLAVIPLIMAGCKGDDSPTSTSLQAAPGPDFQVSCGVPTLTVNRSCASRSCTVTSNNSFSGEVEFRFSGLPPGIRCDTGSQPINVPANGSAHVGLTLSVAPEVELGTYTFQVVGTSGNITQSIDIELVLSGTIPAPAETGGGPMTITGCAGYSGGILSRSSLQQFRSVFVGAWSKTWGGRFCAEIVSEDDGSFSILVPRRCFRQDQLIYLTAGGKETCVTVPFGSGRHAHVTLLGRERGSCE